MVPPSLQVRCDLSPHGKIGHRGTEGPAIVFHALLLTVFFAATPTSTSPPLTEPTSLSSSSSTSSIPTFKAAAPSGWQVRVGPNTDLLGGRQVRDRNGHSQFVNERSMTIAVSRD